MSYFVGSNWFLLISVQLKNHLHAFGRFGAGSKVAGMRVSTETMVLCWKTLDWLPLVGHELLCK